jgi:hypothetical protein
MFGILSSKDEIPAVDGYLALTDQIARTIIMDNPNTFQSVASSMSYPIAKSIEKDHCKYFYFDCIVVFFFTCSLWHSLQTIFFNRFSLRHTTYAMLQKLGRMHIDIWSLYVFHLLHLMT